MLDYLVRVKLARPRSAWSRKHIFDLIVVALPALKPLTLNNVHRRTAGTALRSRAAFGHGEDEPATRQQLRDVKRQLSAIAAQLGEPAKKPLDEHGQEED